MLYRLKFLCILFLIFYINIKTSEFVNLIIKGRQYILCSLKGRQYVLYSLNYNGLLLVNIQV